MASTFPAAIANEPPPLDVSSEEEDSEEFRGLKLDVPSGEPTPVSTPFKRPFTKSPDKGTPANEVVAITDLEENDEAILEIIPSEVEFHSAECSPYKSQSALLPMENGEHLSELHEGTKEVNGIGHENEENVGVIVEEIEEDLCAQTDPCMKEEDEDYVPSSASESTAADICDIDDVATGKNGISVEHFQDCDASLHDDVEGNLDISSEHQHVEHQEISVTLANESQLTNCTEPTDKAVETTLFEEVAAIRDDDRHVVKISEFETFESVNEAHATLPESDEDQVKVSPSLRQTEESELEENDDFGVFQSIPDPVFASDVTSEPAEVEASHNSCFDDDEDDFGDFAQVPARVVTPITTPHAKAQASTDDDDFADFQDCSFQSCDVPGLVSAPSLAPDSPFLSSKIDSIVKSLFEADPSHTEREDVNLRSIDSEISISTDSTWRRVQDFEGSQGLMFKWLNSLTEKQLLKSLNIDNSTIMYHEKWGTIEVPKFAASLVQSPLQPQSCNNLDPHNNSDAHHHSVVVNNNNNITQDMSYQQHDKAPTISDEAQEILRQLPDLSYMRANNLVFPRNSPSGM